MPGYDDGGPDPMGLELATVSGDWYLFISNPILLGTQTEPANDWVTELSQLVDDNLSLVDSTGTEPNLLNAVNGVSGYQMPTGSVENGRVLVSKFSEDHGKAAFGYPARTKTVDYVQRKSTARMKIVWNAGFDPNDYDGVYLPVAGFERDGTFDEKDRMPIQVVSYGTNNG